MTRDERIQRTLDETLRAQKEDSRVRQCFAQLGEWSCLRPVGHDGPCFSKLEIDDYAHEELRRRNLWPRRMKPTDLRAMKGAA